MIAHKKNAFNLKNLKFRIDAKMQKTHEKRKKLAI